MKYVIELEDEPYGRNDDPVIPHGMDLLYRVKGFNSLVFDDEGLKRLTPIGMVTDAAYDDGYTRGYEQARFDFKKDIDDAWDAARKICCNPPVGLDYDTLNEIFGTRNLTSVMAELSAGEAIDMIKTYDEKKKTQRDDTIRIGDIVRHKSVKNLTVYVTYISEEADQFCGLALNDVEDYCEAGDQYTTARLSAFEKTGAHKDIKEALKEMAIDM